MGENFLGVLQDYTAGDPRREGVRWTHLTQQEMGERLTAAGTPVRRRVVKDLLRTPQDVKRKAQKAHALGHPPDRTAQLEHLAQLKQT